MIIDLDNIDLTVSTDDLEEARIQLKRAMDKITDEVRTRAVVRTRALSKGTRVVCLPRVKPSYLKGATGTVVSTAGTWVRVKFELNANNRMSNGNLWRRKWLVGEIYLKSTDVEGTLNNALNRIEA